MIPSSQAARWTNVRIHTLQLIRANAPQLLSRFHRHIGGENENLTSDHFIFGSKCVRDDERVVRSQFIRKKMLAKSFSTEPLIDLDFLPGQHFFRRKRSAIHQAILCLHCLIGAGSCQQPESNRRYHCARKICESTSHQHILLIVSDVRNWSRAVIVTAAPKTAFLIYSVMIYPARWPSRLSRRTPQRRPSSIARLKPQRIQFRRGHARLLWL